MVFLFIASAIPKSPFENSDKYLTSGTNMIFLPSGFVLVNEGILGIEKLIAMLYIYNKFSFLQTLIFAKNVVSLLK
jgi:hypothetical protein